jgi:hypothetical protein
MMRSLWMSVVDRPGLLLPMTLAITTLAPVRAAGQGVRGWVGTTVQAVGLRPLDLDTVPASEVVRDETGALTYQGQPVSCPTSNVCTLYGTKGQATTVAATQDVSLTAWGWGVQGLSFTTLLRGRARAGGDLVWPRSDDAFDVIMAYAQLDRGAFRVRAGRQEVRSGLGFPAFDGAFGSWANRRFEVSAYLGRSLARGLREPANEALRPLESFIPDETVHIIGAAAHARLSAGSATARYQREIYADRSGLVSERGSVDFVSYLRRARVTGSLDYDFGFERVGKGRLTVMMPLRDGRWMVEATARRYVPYFQLSTIWGFFEPVSYSEAELRASWSARSTLALWGSGGWRTYGETNATTVFRPLKDQGWRVGTGVRWELDESWSVDGAYRLEWGPGAFLSSADLGVRYRASDRLALSGHATTFQQVEEFRLGDGRAFGGGFSGDLMLTDRITLAGGASVLRHRDGGTRSTSPWSQSRAWSSLRIAVGADPGLSQRRMRP